MKRQGVDKILDGQGTVIELKPGATEDPNAFRLALISSAAFVSGFKPPDYLLDGILQRGYLYSLTGQTGSGKTAAMLRVLAHVASGRPLDGHDVAQGRALMLVGENADDVRCRWIALCEQMGLFADEIDVHFVPVVFSIRDTLPQLQDRAETVGGFSFVLVDTAAAYFEGDDENNNKQLGDHARDVRTLTTLAGKPTVIVAAHPTKNAAPENMVPRGGGAFLAEVDGNLTCARKDGAVELHWQGKFRGPEFEAISFELLTVTSEKLKDSRGRHMPTVIARPLSGEELRVKADRADADLQHLLTVMQEHPRASIATLAEKAGWVTSDRQPYKSKVQRFLKDLKDQRLATKQLNKWTLTDAGTKAAKELSK